MSSLEEFGAHSWAKLREIVRDDNGDVVCPVSKLPTGSADVIDIPAERIVDNQLYNALQEESVEHVRSRGHESSRYDILMPETVSGPEAHGYSNAFVGVEVEFVSSIKWIPVRRDDLPDLEDVVDDDHGETRVGHCRDDDCDIYIGRHGENGQNDITNTEIGEAGWLGNPFRVGAFGREESLARYCDLILKRVDADPEFAKALAEDVSGSVLGCWCRRLDEEDPACHGDVVARVADALEKRDPDAGGDSA